MVTVSDYSVRDAGLNPHSANGSLLGNPVSITLPQIVVVRIKLENKVSDLGSSLGARLEINKHFRASRIQYPRDLL